MKKKKNTRTIKIRQQSGHNPIKALIINNLLGEKQIHVNCNITDSACFYMHTTQSQSEFMIISLYLITFEWVIAEPIYGRGSKNTLTPKIGSGGGWGTGFGLRSLSLMVPFAQNI